MFYIFSVYRDNSWYYVSIHTERNSKHLDDLLASAPKFPIENKAGDNDILRVIEMYCAGGKAGAVIRTFDFCVLG